MIFRNKGELDVTMLTVMGVSVKEIDDPIGKFGTGLKYAISVLLRENIPVTLYIGENKFEFFTETREIRGKEFQMCMMMGPYDAIELPYATNYGANWAPWQAYREIVSNWKDEGGCDVVVNNTAPGIAGYTTFILGDIAESETVFLDTISSEPFIKTKHLEVYANNSKYLYLNGIRVSTLSKPSMYTYNILKDIDLTEDRTISYTWQVEEVLIDTIITSDNSDFISKIIQASNTWYEATLNFGFNHTKAPAEIFKTQVDYMRQLNQHRNPTIGPLLNKYDLPPKPSLSNNALTEKCLQSMLMTLAEYYDMASQANADATDKLKQAIYTFIQGTNE